MRPFDRSGFRPIVAGVLALLTVPTHADIFGSNARVPTQPAASVLPDATCQIAAPPSPLTLFYVIERSLCQNPKSRGAWSDVKRAAAAWAAAKANYLPEISLEARYGLEHHTTDVSDSELLRSYFKKGVNEEALSLSWVLYDFGGRAASVRGSNQLLLATQANEDAVLQSVFAAAAKDFYKAQAASSEVLARRRIESIAGQNLEAASSRVQKGAVPITDELQAKTARAQAVFERVRAEGRARVAAGTLAIEMNLLPDEPLVLPEFDAATNPKAEVAENMRALLTQAKEGHPQVLAAASQWKAALENVRIASAQGRPSIKLVGQIERNTLPVSASLGQPELAATSRDDYIGFKIDVPLFSGFKRHYEVKEAKADAERREQTLHDVQASVANAVWTSVEETQTAGENLRNMDIVRASAREAFDAAGQRYQAGVGNMLELLSAQNSLSTADQQWIQSQLEWRMARIDLAESLGTLGTWTIE